MGADDIDSYDFQKRVEKGLRLRNENALEALDVFNEILEDFKNLSPEELSENNFDSIIINSLNAKGSILNAWDEIDEAEECFDAVLDNYDNSDFTSLINKCLILRKRQHLEESLEYYDRIMEMHPKKKELIIAMKSEVYDDLKIKLDEADLDSYDDGAKELIFKGIMLFAEKKLLDALDSYKKAVEIDSNSRYLIWSLLDEVKKEFFKLFIYENPDMNKDEKSRKMGSVLYYLFIENNPFYAYTLNEELLDEDENDLFALNAKGMIFFFLDDYDLSLGYFNKAIDSGCEYLYPYFNRAVLLSCLKRFDEAKESYDVIMSLPKRVSYLNEEQKEIFNRAVFSNSVYALGF